MIDTARLLFLPVLVAGAIGIALAALAFTTRNRNK